ncbi:MAG: hypothetical protein RML56_15100 [Burkholderiales bacterium]|nr:hypothetical protein [Burkholderiales bacterium]
MSPGNTQSSEPPRAAVASSECWRASSREVRAADHDALAKVGQLAPYLGFRHRLAGAQENVPHPRLRHLRLAACAARIEELQHVKAGRAAQHLAHLARLHARERPDEKLGQPVGRAPAHRPAREGIRRIRVARRKARKIAAGERLGARPLGLGARLRDTLGRSLLGQPHEDVREVVLDGAAPGGAVLLEKEVDFALAHLDAVVHLALAQPREHHLHAHLLAEALERDAVALEQPPELDRRQAVVLRDALERAVELDLVDADAGFLRELQLRFLEDQALEQLTLEHFPLGRRRALAAQLPLGRLDALAQLEPRDDVAVDHRDDAIEEHDRLRGRRPEGGEQRGRDRARAAHR